VALCTDQSLTYLNKLGYNVVRVPRKGIEPLDVLGRDRSGIALLGRLDQVWTSKNAIPTVGAPQPATNVNGQRTSELSPSLGIQVLSNVLKAIGAEVPELSFAFKRAKKLQFAFDNVTSTTVVPLEVGRFLAAGDIDAKNPVIDHYFTDQDSEAFVITEVLKSDQVSLVALDEANNKLTIDVPSIKQVVGAKVEVSSVGSDSTEIKFKGVDAVTFGFKAFSIAYDGKWHVAGTEASGNLAFEVPAGGQEPRPTLLNSGRTIVMTPY
jgi:hypothetical protein